MKRTSVSVALLLVTCAASGIHGVATSAPSAATSSVRVGVGDATITEGDVGKANVAVPVSLDAPSATSIVVGYQVTSADATSTDFVAKTGTVKFAAGSTQRSILVTTLGDQTLEQPEHLTVTLTGAGTATITDRTGIVTINDDDASIPAASAPPEVSVGDITVWEGNRGTGRSALVPIVLSKPATVATRISLTTSCGSADGGDYYTQASSVQFNIGQRSKTVAVRTRADRRVETDETFDEQVSVQSGSASVFDGTAVSTIADDDASFGFTGNARVSQHAAIGCNGAGYNGDSFNPSVSRDGNWILFGSTASDIVAGDTNGNADVFLSNLQTGAVERVSLGWNGAEVAGSSWPVAVSGTGRFVIFGSGASGLLAGGVPSWGNYLLDRQLHTLEWYPPGAVSISDDGRYLTYQENNPFPGDVDVCPPLGSPTCTSADVMLRDRVLQTNTAVTPNLGWDAQISGDGNTVVYHEISHEDPATQYGGQIVAFDRLTGLTTLVSHDANGQEMQGLGALPSAIDVSYDGRFVVFAAASWNLEGLSTAPPGSGNGNVYIVDRSTDTIEPVSVDAAGVPSGAAGAAGAIAYPSVSDDGRYVAFTYPHELYNTDWSPATQGELGSSHVIVRDRLTGTMAHGDVDMNGDRPDYDARATASGGSLSGTGQVLTFSSAASDIVFGDTGGVEDVFIRVNW